RDCLRVCGFRNWQPVGRAFPTHSLHTIQFDSAMEATRVFPPTAPFRVDAAQSRLGRAFWTAPLSRQTDPNRVWHSPRFHSRPATLLRPPFCPFHRSVLFLPAAAQVKKETSRKR